MSPSTLTLTIVAASGAVLVAPTAFATTVSPILTEIRIDQSGSDNDEFFEIYGDAGASLNGWSLITVGDASADSFGYIENVVNLNGLSFGSNGVFVGTESTFTQSIDPLASSGVFGATGLNFENSDNVTFMLVYEFSGAIGSDIDTNNDRIMDASYWSSLGDSVSLVVLPGAGDGYYGAASVGPDGTFVPGHVYRDGYGAWQIGAFALGTNDTPGTYVPIPTPGAMALLAVAGLGRRRARR